MKIAVIGTRGFPDVQGGVENHCEHLYVQMVKLGCDVIVFTRSPYVGGRSGIYEGVKLTAVDCPRNKFLEAIVHTFKCVVKARMLNPDIVHIHAVGPSLFAPLARLLGMKVVITNHGPDYMRKKWSMPAKIFLRFCEWMGILFANEVITIAKNIADDIKNKYGRNSTVLPNGVNILQPAETEEYLKKYGLQKQKYILSVGRFVPEKGFDDLIDAFNSLQGAGDRSQIEEWKLVIVGDADHEDSYSLQLKAKAATNDKIVLTGFLTGKALQEIYTHAGLFVLASYYEGLPIVLLEAMSYGLSCIASDIPANRNVTLDNDRFFKVGDIEMLMSKISKFIVKSWNDEDRKQQINMIDNLYNWERIANETFYVYERIALH